MIRYHFYRFVEANAH